MTPLILTEPWGPRAITLKQPWAWLMLYGPKRIENRPWKPWPQAIGQRIYVHQGKAWDEMGAEYIRRVMPELEFPALARTQGILGSFVVNGCLDKRWDVPAVGQEQWFFGPFGWLTSEPRALERPVTARGAQGLWRIPPGPMRQLRAMGALET